MGRSRKQLEATAYHEAGHAVAEFWLNDEGIRWVTIAADDEAQGRTMRLEREWLASLVEWDIPDDIRAELEKEVVISLAGKEAQRYFNPRSLRSHHYADDCAPGNVCTR